MKNLFKCHHVNTLTKHMQKFRVYIVEFKINKVTIFVALSTRTSLTLKCTQKMIHTRWVTYSLYDENVRPLKKYLDLIWNKTSKLQNWWRYSFSRHTTERTSYIHHFGLMIHMAKSSKISAWDVSYLCIHMVCQSYF
jgi:hypothetical protein